MKQLKCSRIN